MKAFKHQMNRTLLPSISFVLKEICKGLVANDIESRCKNLREMKDVFKKLKVLGRKGNVALHNLTKIYWKQYLQVQARF